MKLVGRLFAWLWAPVRRWLGRRTPFQIGALALVVLAVVSAALMYKPRLQVQLRPGERIAADFPAHYKLEPILSKVKVAGLRVGTVTAVTERRDGTARVVMKVAPGTRAKLRAEPTAHVRPTTLLSGPGMAQYVELRPGGPPGRAPAVIPRNRTTLPVELDHVLEVFTEEARRGLGTTVRGLDTALADGGSAALGEALEAAPPALRPAVPVLTAFQGEQSGDLTSLVSHLGRAADALTANDGELEAVVNGLATVASRLQARTPEITATLEHLPGNLAKVEAALQALNGTLTRLQQTAPAVRPAVAELRPLLDQIRPVLAEARPVVADLRPLVTDARPLIEELTPTARLAERVLSNLDGPVLGRLNGDVIPTLLAPYQNPADPTLHTGSPLYKETAYAIAALAGVVKYTNANGAMVRVDLVFNEDSAAGSPPLPGRSFHVSRRTP